MSVRGIDHVQLAMPAGGEARARAFYADLLGMEEVPKPPLLAARGGCWFRGGAAIVHLGVEPDFRPAAKAHPGLLVNDLRALRERLEAAGHPCTNDVRLPGIERAHATDPFGNRLEFLERTATGDRGRVVTSGDGDAAP